MIGVISNVFFFQILNLECRLEPIGRFNVLQEIWVAHNFNSLVWKDSSEVNPKKRTLLLSNIEKHNEDNDDDHTYEAKFQLNGNQEMIEFVYDGGYNDARDFEGHATLRVVRKKMCFRGSCNFPSVEVST